LLHTIQIDNKTADTEYNTQPYFTIINGSMKMQ